MNIEFLLSRNSLSALLILFIIMRYIFTYLLMKIKGIKAIEIVKTTTIFIYNFLYLYSQKEILMNKVKKNQKKKEIKQNICRNTQNISSRIHYTIFTPFYLYSIIITSHHIITNDYYPYISYLPFSNDS